MKKIVSFLLVLVMVMGTLAACGGGSLTDGLAGQAGPTSATQPVSNQPQPTQADEAEVLKPDTDGGFEVLSATKIGTLSVDSIYTNSSAGLIYRADNGKYGILSLDGKQDTGAKYTSCTPVGNYFTVMTADANSITDVASLNCAGVVDATGKEIIPLQYASIDKISDRYIRACEVTEQTTNKDEALVYYTDKLFSITASDGDTLFKGKWYVYDTVTGKKLEGVSASNNYQIITYGDFIKYVTDAQEQITVNHKGQTLPQDADLFENGYYALTEGSTGAVYDSEGNKAFTFTENDFIPTDSEDQYILAAKYINDVRTYVLLDLTGKVVSAQFTDMPMVYGGLIHADDKVYTFDGQQVIEGTYSYLYADEQFGKAWFVRNGEEYTMFTADGTVLYQGTEDDTTSFDAYSDFYISKKVGDKRMYYCLADKDFTLEGAALAPWLVQVTKADNTRDVVDFSTGNTLISGYSSYSYVAIANTAIYVYAQNADGGLDIYTVK